MKRRSSEDDNEKRMAFIERKQVTVVGGFTHRYQGDFLQKLLA
jgi:hypothetical protein